MGNPASGKASANCDHLKELIREVPDFPKKGILFYDITTLLKDKTGFATLIDALSEHFISDKIDLVFKDITPVLSDPVLFHVSIDLFLDRCRGKKIDKIVGIDARGFIFAAAAAVRLQAGFVPVRKPGKLPAATQKYDYALEYGTNTLEIHSDAIQKGQRVIIVDDLLATGGTAEATAKLAESLGAEIAGMGFVVELDFLNPRKKLTQYDIFSLLHYDK